VLLPVHEQDDAAEQHVDGRGEEGWRHEEQDALQDVGAHGPVGRLGVADRAADVADPFD